MLQDLAETALVADTDERVPRPGAAERVAAQERGHLTDRVVDCAGHVERVAGQPCRQPLSANRRQDRVHETVQPRDLGDSLGAPLFYEGRIRSGSRLVNAGRSAARPGGIGRGVSEQVHVCPDDGQRRAQLVRNHGE